jgi:hypothetical protein
MENCHSDDYSMNIPGANLGQDAPQERSLEAGGRTIMKTVTMSGNIVARGDDTGLEWTQP